VKRSAQRTPATKRRSHGTGTLYHDSERDRWVGAVTIAGRRHKVVARTKTDASARLAGLVAARTTGTLVDDRSYTVAQAVDVFLSREVPSRRRHGGPLAPATVTGYRWACDIIVSRLGKVRLANLTAEDVEAFYDELAARNGGPDSVASLRKIRTTLQQVIDVAVRRHKVTHNVATVATIPHAADAAKPRRALDPAAARKLLAALRDERNGTMFALSLRVGLRPGEAAGLWWDDLDGNVLHVQRGRQAVGGRVEVVDNLKTEASRRSIELPVEIVDWLSEHRRQQVAERLAAPGWRDERLVFASTGGRVLSPPNVRRQLEAICRRAGVPVVRPNELRHSCASLLSDIGVPNERIADLLGHSTTRMVDQTYRHRLRPVVDVAATQDWTRATR
jgi:integrase